jgi:GTP pyrophosphokinase
MALSEFTTQDYEIIEREYAVLREAAQKRCANQEEFDIVHKAYEFANQAHKGIRRRSGEPYIIHPIQVATIVVTKIGLGYKSIVAALLHDVVEDTEYTTEDISNLFGEKVASLVDGLTKIKVVLDNDVKAQQKSVQAENFKRILLTLNDDVRVVLIKLADRLHNCRTIEYMPEYKRDKILSETMFIFIPLAHRLGLYEVKSEMEDIWLRYKEPEAFQKISARIDKNVIDKEAQIDEFIAPINEALVAAGFRFYIKKRVKTPYSIWKKMNKKGIPFDQIYDLYAVRIIFDCNENVSESERDQCYHIFSIITGIYRYKADRVRDWVKFPKNNGYEALHCTLMSNSGIWIEVQIRSKRMDDIAEKGIAAHWSYKKDGGNSSVSEMDKWIEKIKEIIVNPDVNALELLDIIHKDLVSSDILVFTPKGEQKSIQKGATALDFAYLIHSEIGHKAIAAKVNMKLVPLSYVLKSGDQVEIITAQNESPKGEWLNFLQTRRAKNTVLDYLKDERNQFITEGKRQIVDKLSSMGLKLNTDTLASLMNGYEIFGTEEELYLRVGLGILNLNTIQDIIGNNPEKSKGWNFNWFKSNSSKNGLEKQDSYIISDSLETKRKYVFAHCCHPIPGDSVVGFLSSDGVITVHKKSCNVANSIAAKHGDRIVKAEWDVEKRAFLVRLSLKGFDKMGMINEITSKISNEMNVNIRKFVISSDAGIFEGYVDLYVHDKNILDKLIKSISKINGIQNVLRTDL